MPTEIPGCHDLALSPLLVGLEEKEVQALLATAEPCEHESGSTIVEEGSAGDTLFMICEGEVLVEKAAEGGGSVELARFAAAGDFFGEMVFVDVMPRSATVRASRSTRLLAFRLEKLRAFFDSHPGAHLAIVLNIARMLSKRLREADERIVELTGANG
jgi:CRP-like cAMP-binding protein